MSGRVLMVTEWPGLQMLFYDFATGYAMVRDAHHRALQRQVYPIVRAVKTRYSIVGSASRRGDAATVNMPLSRQRGENILLYIRREARMEMRRLAGRAMGERVAGGGPNANHARDRSVAFALAPLMDERDAIDPADRICRAFQQIITNRGNPPSNLSGEQRAGYWNPLDARLSGFGTAMRSYLMDLPSSRYGLTEPIPRGPFLERVMLNPRRIRNVRSRVQHHDTGQDDAYRLWNGFNADQRWAIKRQDRALDILGDLCDAYRRSWAQHFGRGASQSWTPGMCGFLTAEEEQQRRGG